MPRDYDVKGTTSFLWWSVGLAVLCVWCIKDGWFPSGKVLDKHPPGTDGFYLFNKSMAFFSGVASAVCGFIHKFVR